MHVLFGACTTDIEEARVWVAALSGLSPDPRINEYNGQYYSFVDVGSGERMKLMSSVCNDEDGSYPAESDFADWKILLQVNGTNVHSRVLMALESQPEKFRKLRSS